MNNDKDQPASNEETIQRIKSGELGPVEFRCEEGASEAEKLRVARANAEQQLAITRRMVSQGEPLAATILNMTEAAEAMENSVIKQSELIGRSEWHRRMQMAQALRLASMWLKSNEPATEAEKTVNGAIKKTYGEN